MIDLIIYYATETDYLKLFVISILPILMAPLIVLVITRYIFQRFDPDAKMTPTKLFMFVALAIIISVLIMLTLLFIFLPPGTDFRLPLIATLVIFGLLGAGRLYLVEPSEEN